MKQIVKEYEVRYFAGIEYEGGIDLKNRVDDIPALWDNFFSNELENIQKKHTPLKYIGLECYPPDFSETKMFDYYALVQLNELISVSDNLVTKKLPAGKYISFEIKYDEIKTEIHRVYKYLKEENIKIHNGFNYEDYLNDQNYGEKGAILHFSFLLEE